MPPETISPPEIWEATRYSGMDSSTVPAHPVTKIRSTKMRKILVITDIYLKPEARLPGR
jgi:hypothetical protein